MNYICKDELLKKPKIVKQISNIWKTQQGPQDWKMLVFIPIPKKGNAKECSNYHRIALISHTSKVMLKILQARLQQYMNHKPPDVQAGFRKGRGTRWSSRCRKFDLWFLCPFQNQLERLEVHGSCIVEAWLGEFWALLYQHVRWAQLCNRLSILWHCLSLGLEWKLTFSSPVATAEFSKFAGILIECSTFTASSFRIWNSSTEILSLPIALFVVMLSKAHLTSHSRMSGSRWVISPSWLSWSWRSFCTVLCIFTTSS